MARGWTATVDRANKTLLSVAQEAKAARMFYGMQNRKAAEALRANTPTLPTLKRDANNKNIDTRSGQRYSLPPEIRNAATVPSPDLDKNAALARFSAAVWREENRGAQRKQPQTRLERVSFDASLPADSEIRKAEAVARSQGKEVVWYRALGTHPYNGAAFGHPRFVFVNVNGTLDPVFVTAGHEVTHLMQREAPEIYRELEAVVLAQAKNRTRFDENRRGRRYEERQLNEELVADFVGESLQDPTVLTRALGDNPTLLERVQAFIRRVLEQIRNRLGRNDTPTARGAIANLRTAERALEKAWREWAAKSGESLYSESDIPFRRNDRENTSPTAQSATVPRTSDYRREAEDGTPDFGPQQQPSDSMLSRQDSDFASLRDLEAWAETRGVQLDAYERERDGTLHISRIEVPKRERGRGVGSEVMEAITRYADKTGAVITLSPSTDFGGSSVDRLRRFYKQFGFIDNRGGKKDFRYYDSMIRRPVKPTAQAPQASPPDIRFNRQEPAPEDATAKKRAVLERLIDANIDDLLAGRMTKQDILRMARAELNPRVTSTKNAVTDREREERGIEAAKEVAAREFPDVWAEMQRQVAENPGDAKAFYDLMKLKARPVSDLENALLLQHQISLQTDFDRAVQRLENAKTDAEQEEAGAQLDTLRDELQSMYDVLQKVGTESARGLNARRMLAAHDFTLARMEATIRAKANKGKPLTEKQKPRIRDVHKRIATAEEKLLNYEKRIASLPKNRSLAASAKAARDRLRARLQKASDAPRPQFARQENSAAYNPLADYAVVGAELIDNGATDFARWSAQMRKEFGNVPDIKGLFAASQDLHREYVTEALAKDKERIRGRIEKIKDRANRRDFSKPPKRPVRMDPEKLELLRELESAKKAYNNLLALEVRKNRTPLGKFFGGIGDTLSLIRAFKSSGDISAPGRQGLLTVAAHPILSRHAFKDQFKALVSEKAYERQQIELKNRENWKNGWYKEANLGFRDVNETSISKQDEIIAARWGKYLPGVNPSARAYTAFLNRLIADTFDAMVEGAGARNTPELRKIIAENLNIQTGRAPFGRFEPAMVLLNQVYFAPKLTVSRFQYLLGMPLWKAVATKNPYAMRIVATEYVRSLTGIAALYAFLLMLQDDEDPMLGIDPRNKSTFLTVRVGDSRIEFLAGLKQAATFGTQFIWKEKYTRSGELKRLDGAKWGEDDIGDLLGQFHRSKLHPALGAAYSAHKGKDFVGRETGWIREAIGLAMPMPVPTTYEIMKEHDLDRGLTFTIMAALGGGIQTYSDDTKTPEPTLEDEIMDFVGIDR